MKQFEAITVFQGGLVFLGLVIYFKQKWLKNHYRELLLLAGSFFIMFLLMEAGLRIYILVNHKALIEQAFANTKNPTPNTTVTLGEMIRSDINETIIYGLKPNLNVYHLNSLISTNSDGWRDDEFYLEKPADTKRIVVLGDSVAFGWGVEKDERYSEVLEELLGSAFTEFKWEVYVFSAPGYSLFNEVEVLKEQALLYDPDLIIYSYVHNDHCLPSFLQTRSSLLTFRSIIFDYLRPDSWTADYLSSKHGLNLVYGICSASRAPKKYKQYVGEDAFALHLDKFITMTEKKDIPLVFWVTGVMFKDLPREYLSYSIDSDNFYYINVISELEELYASYSSEELVLSKTDAHPSAIGHRLFGEVLFDKLNDFGILLKMTE